MAMGYTYKKIKVASNTVAGYHAISIVGWGQQEDGECTEYYSVNSHRGNECIVEEFVLGVRSR